MKLAKALVLFFFLLISSHAFGTTITITFGGTSFSPSSVNCSVGDVIVFSGSFAFHIIQSTSVPSGAAAFGPTTAATTSFSYTVTTAGTYDYQCNIHYTMGMTGSFTATAAAGVKGITLAPATLDFGSIRVGTSLGKTVSVNSVGPDDPLTVSTQLSTGTQFSTSPTAPNRIIAVGSSETETVTFSPTARGSFSDVLTISSDATNAGDQTKTVTVTGKGINGDFAGGTTIDFGTVRAGKVKQITYSFRNSGDDDLFINNSSTSGAGFSVVVPPAGDISAGAGGSVVVQFAPTGKQNYDGSLTLTALNSVSIPQISLTGAGSAPVLTLPTPASIGGTAVSTLLHGSLQVSNTGNDTLHVASLSLSQTGTKFSLTSGLGFTVLPGAKHAVSIDYSSTVAGIDSASLTINSDDPAIPVKVATITAGSGYPTMGINTTDTLDFGSISKGGVGFDSLLITNSGFADLLVQIDSFSSSLFSVANLSSDIPGLQKTKAVLQFTPTATGVFQGSAIVTSNDSDHKKSTIYLRGTGVNSNLAILTSVAFPNLAITKTHDTTLTIANTAKTNTTVYSYSISPAGSGFLFVDTTAHLVKTKSSIQIKVRFAPTQIQPYTASIIISTNDSTTGLRKIALSGNGIDTTKAAPVLSTDVPSIDFGTVDSGKSLSKTFTIKNTGTGIGTISALTLSGDPSFTTPKVTTPFTIAAAASKDISVTFSPVAVGTFTGTYTITGTEGTPLTVTLTGKGQDTVKQGPNAVSIAQAYGLQMTLAPNPANSSATLKITLAKESEMSIELFDVTGNHIRTISHGRYGEGESAIPFSTQTLPSGEYYLRASINGISAAEAKIVVVH
jgi:plastocyanin